MMNAFGRTLVAAVCVLTVAPVFLTARADELAAVQSEPFDAPAVDPFAGRTSMSRADAFALIRTRLHNAPRLGDLAPPFELKTADGQETIRLQDYLGKKPVVLIFGSMT